MEADVTRFENHAAFERRSECLPASLHALIPEVDMAAPLFIPDWIDAKVEAPMELSVIEAIEIDMHVEWQQHYMFSPLYKPKNAGAQQPNSREPRTPLEVRPPRTQNGVSID
jgi:hypothetical protein